MSIITPASLQEKGIRHVTHAFHAEKRATIHEPEVISVTLMNDRGETFQAETYCVKRDHVLTEKDFLQLVLDRYNETKEDRFKRSWQYKKWGTSVYQLSPRLAKPGYGAQVHNEFDYYHYDPQWYDHQIKRPYESFKNRFEQFIS